MLNQQEEIPAKGFHPSCTSCSNTLSSGGTPKSLPPVPAGRSTSSNGDSASF